MTNEGRFLIGVSWSIVHTALFVALDRPWHLFGALLTIALAAWWILASKPPRRVPVRAENPALANLAFIYRKYYGPEAPRQYVTPVRYEKREPRPRGGRFL